MKMNTTKYKKIKAKSIHSDTSLEESFLKHLVYSLAKDEYSATERDCFQSIALAVRDRLVERWIQTQQTYHNKDAKRVYYLSLEFMIGRLLGNALVNLGLYKETEKVMNKLGLNLDDLIEYESDAALGHGGLGRLAACFLNSMATMNLPAYGYGIRYEFGIFSQKIENGYQMESPDGWLRYGNPWEIERPEFIYMVKFYGKVKEVTDAEGNLRYVWVDTKDIIAMAYDTPIPGYKNNTVNNLRLWSAKSTREFNLEYFNHGDYDKAIEDKLESELISKILYPKGDFIRGKELKLKQEYFLVSATIQDIIRRFKKSGGNDFSRFPDNISIQINETHPVLIIPELMRILIDKENLTWEQAWEITKATVNYTNHTILPEALEIWPVNLLEELLPRHLQILYEINRRFLDEIQSKFPGDVAKLSRMSIVEESTHKKIRMANVALAGCFKVNGVAELHTEIMKERVFSDFYQVYPEKFLSITNGISQRRWLKLSNPDLSELISSVIGDEWVTNLFAIRKLENFTDDSEFRRKWNAVKKKNKIKFSNYINKQFGLQVDPASFFDCHTKAVHEYKRQLLNVLHIITLYNRLREGQTEGLFPRTVIFSGKAAPGYTIAKLIIKLINSVAAVVNNDSKTNEWLKVIYVPNYSVSQAQRIIPAADLSEQISTPGFEASGTGNMKYAMNGALTIGTLDGANIEIKKEVGDKNIFIFGMTAQGVNHLQQSGYNPRDYYDAIPELKHALDSIGDGTFSEGEKALFYPIIDSLLNHSDYYCVLADYPSYVECHQKITDLYRSRRKWTQKSILNVARVGKFSSDRTIEEYAKQIWKVKPIQI